MFNFLKEKLKNVFEKFKKEESSLEKGEKELEKKAEEEKKEVKQIEKEEKELEEEKKEIGKKLKGAKKEEIKEKAIKQLEKVEEKIEDLEEEKEAKKGFFKKIKSRFSSAITEEQFEGFFQDLEIILIENNIAMKIIDELKANLSKEIVGKPLKKAEIDEKIRESLKRQLKDALIEPFDLIEKMKEKKEKPFVMVFFGINGAGKTTAIAKIAHLLKKQGLSSVLAASDTFRAASIEQLEKHAKALDVKMIKHDYGSDPAAVAFDAIAHARARNIDAVLIDTAGRMHTKADLMKEMEKICRVAKPDLKIFVGESIVGNDVIEQASKFNNMIGIDASILTKADVDEKGGAMISIGKVTGKPIIFLGTGQKYDDLEKFDPEKIIKSIF